MADIENEDLYDLSDEELEAAFKEAKASRDTVEQEEIAIEEEVVEDTTDDEIEDDEEDLEQPDDEDSEDDSSLEEDDIEEDDEDSETDDDELDGDITEEEEQTEAEPEVEDDTKQPAQAPEVLKYKANGKEFEFTLDEVKEKFGQVFGQAMDYTKKTQAIKKDRKKLDAINSANLSDEDLSLAIDVLKGDKDALSAVLKRTGIDAIDLDTETESNYVPKDYGRDDSELALQDVINSISADPEYKQTEAVIGKQWDDASWGELSKNPKLIGALHEEIKSGVFNEVDKIATKLKVYGGDSKSDLGYYREAASIYNGKLQSARQQKDAERAAREAAAVSKAEADKIAKVKKAEAKRTTVKKEASKRKAAAPTRKKAATKVSIDYLDDSDESFSKWYAELQDKY